MKNNYKQLMSASPNEPSAFKRSASHSLRSSLRLPRKRNNVPISCSSLPPPFIPRKAAALLDISLPPKNLKALLKDSCSNKKLPEPVKVATIRRRSVWANSSASKIVTTTCNIFHRCSVPVIYLTSSSSFLLEISLPSYIENDRAQNRPSLSHLFDIKTMRIREVNAIRSLDNTNIETMNDGSSILKEINKNTSADNFKSSKKHKFGHGARRQEENLLCGETTSKPSTLCVTMTI